jgi:hypothetical protein
MKLSVFCIIIQQKRSVFICNSVHQIPRRGGVKMLAIEYKHHARQLYKFDLNESSHGIKEERNVN